MVSATIWLPLLGLDIHLVEEWGYENRPRNDAKPTAELSVFSLEDAIAP